jgi:hypothetical protein
LHHARGAGVGHPPPSSLASLDAQSGEIFRSVPLRSARSANYFSTVWSFRPNASIVSAERGPGMGDTSKPMPSRRGVLRGAVVLGGVAVWSTPTVTVLSGKAFAAGPGSPRPPAVQGESFQRPQLPERPPATETPSVRGTSASSSSGGVLPFTGANFPVIETVEIGAAAVAAGAVMSTAARRRADARDGAAPPKD